MEIVLRDLLSRRRWNYIVLGVLDAIDGDGGGDDDDVRAVHGKLRELLVEFDVLEDRVDDRQRRRLLGLAQNDYVHDRGVVQRDFARLKREHKGTSWVPCC